MPNSVYNLTEIARLFGVSRPTAYLIVRREDFPKPVPKRLSLTGKPLPPAWSRTAVELWHRLNGGAE